MAKVIVREADYNYANLKPIFFSMMDALAGDQIKPGSRVLIKPNMLCVAEPKDAILTHPLIIKAAVEYVLQKGAHPQVSDSPAIELLRPHSQIQWDGWKHWQNSMLPAFPSRKHLPSISASLTAKSMLQPML